MRQELYPIPENWAWATVEDIITDAQPGFASGRKNLPNGINHLRMNNISGECALDLSSVITVPKELARPAHILRPGDVLFCHTNSEKLVGKTALFDRTNGPYAFSNHLTRLRLPVNGPPPEWLWFWLSTLWRQRYFETRCKQWVNQATVERNTLLSAPIPVGPIQEQRRIIDLVLETRKRNHIARTALQRVSFLIKQFRRGILSKAFHGELTERDSNDEPASVLFNHIQSERRKWFGRKYEEPKPPPSSPLSEPKTWIWSRIRDISFAVTKGATPTSYGFDYVPSGIRFVKVENLHDGRIQRDKISQFVTPNFHQFLKRSQLKKSDVLFTIAGTIGKVAIVEEEDLPANINQAIAVIRCPWQFVDPQYLASVLASSVTQMSISDRPRGVAMSNVSLEDVMNIICPLPPFEEQGRIFAVVSEMSSNANHVDESAGVGLRTLERLEQSLLVKAFRGELLPQNPNDEAASVLLERIRANRPMIGKRGKSPTLLEIANPAGITPKA